MPMEFEYTSTILIAVFVAFMLAGFVKGVIGLGLPTIAIGLLATVMTPAHALAIVIAPAIITNIWQTFGGPYFYDIVRRLWPLLIATCLGVWTAADLLTGRYAPYGALVIGVLLVIYASLGLSRVEFSVAKKDEYWLGSIMGAISGVITAGTGVQAIPAMPFMQAIGMEKDELVQALGIYFTTGTVALIFNLADAGLLNVAIALPGAIAMAAAFLGMFLGQVLRARMEPATFRRWFLISMILLGLYLVVDKLVTLYG